jgi:hypothetical protein
MIKKILKFLPPAILIAIPSVISLYNNLESRIDCNLNAYKDHPNCVLASNKEVQTITQEKINQSKAKLEKAEKPELIISNTVAEINTLREQIYKKNTDNLDEKEKKEILEKTAEHNKLVLELMNELSIDAKIRVCKRNDSFVANDSIQLEIKKICDEVLDKQVVPSVEGINSENNSSNLFEIKMEDL